MSEGWLIRTCTESPWWSPWWWAIIGLGPQRPKARVPALSGVFPIWIGGEDWRDLICTVMEAERKSVPAALKGLLIFESSCQIQLYLCATTRNHLNRALRAGSVLWCTHAISLVRPNHTHHHITGLPMSLNPFICLVLLSPVQAVQVMNVWGMINQDLLEVSWWSPWWRAIIGLGPQRLKVRASPLTGVFPSWIGGEDWREGDMILYYSGSWKRKFVPAALKGLLIFESSCKFQLHLCITTRNHSKHAWRDGSVL
jgi:hypothetical protein